MSSFHVRGLTAAVVLVVAVLVPAAPVGAADHTLVGKIVSVDHKAHKITISTGGKNETHAVSPQVEVIGPKGGVSPHHLTDSRLAPGVEVKLVFGGGGKMVAKIHIEK
jgi:hypothetical protein